MTETLMGKRCMLTREGYKEEQRLEYLYGVTSVLRYGDLGWIVGGALCGDGYALAFDKDARDVYYLPIAHVVIVD